MKLELTEGDSLEGSTPTAMNNPHILPLRRITAQTSKKFAVAGWFRGGWEKIFGNLAPKWRIWCLKRFLKQHSTLILIWNKLFARSVNSLNILWRNWGEKILKLKSVKKRLSGLRLYVFKFSFFPHLSKNHSPPPPPPGEGVILQNIHPRYKCNIRL